MVRYAAQPIGRGWEVRAKRASGAPGFLARGFETAVLHVACIIRRGLADGLPEVRRLSSFSADGEGQLAGRVFGTALQPPWSLAVGVEVGEK